MNWDFPAAERAIFQAIKERDFSGVIYIRRESEVVLAPCCGMAQRADNVPIRIDGRLGPGVRVQLQLLSRARTDPCCFRQC